MKLVEFGSSNFKVNIFVLILLLYIANAISTSIVGFYTYTADQSEYLYRGDTM